METKCYININGHLKMKTRQWMSIIKSKMAYGVSQFNIHIFWIFNIGKRKYPNTISIYYLTDHDRAVWPFCYVWLSLVYFTWAFIIFVSQDVDVVRHNIQRIVSGVWYHSTKYGEKKRTVGVIQLRPWFRRISSQQIATIWWTTNWKHTQYKIDGTTNQLFLFFSLLITRVSLCLHRNIYFWMILLFWTVLVITEQVASTKSICHLSHLLSPHRLADKKKLFIALCQQMESNHSIGACFHQRRSQHLQSAFSKSNETNVRESSIFFFRFHQHNLCFHCDLHSVSQLKLYIFCIIQKTFIIVYVNRHILRLCEHYLTRFGRFGYF